LRKEVLFATLPERAFRNAKRKTGHFLNNFKEEKGAFPKSWFLENKLPEEIDAFLHRSAPPLYAEKGPCPPEKRGERQGSGPKRRGLLEIQWKKGSPK